MALFQTAGFAAQIQAAKGTPAATGFIKGRMSTSAANPRYDVVDNSGEHTWVHERPTVDQSTPIRAGYIADVTANWRLYPYLLPVMLVMNGFKITTSTIFTLTITAGDTGDTYTLTYNNTGSNPQTTTDIAFDALATAVAAALNALSNKPTGGFTVTGDAEGPYTITVVGAVAYGTGGATNILTCDDTLMDSSGTSAAALSSPRYSHVATLADADELAWGTVLSALDEGDNRYTRRAYDVRGNNLTIEATRAGIACAMGGLGLRESDAAGTETFVSEPNSLLSQANGSFTLTSSDLTAATLGTPIENLLTIANPLDEEEQELHSFYRAEATPTALKVTGELRRLVWSEDIFKEFIYGAAAGTEPVIEIPEAALAWSFQSPGNISAGIGVPYSVSTSIAVVQMMMQPFDVTGGGRIRYNAQYTMLDRASTAPITITIINDHPTYAGT
jgi:hypothetical protein